MAEGGERTAFDDDKKKVLAEFVSESTQKPYPALAPTR